MEVSQNSRNKRDDYDFTWTIKVCNVSEACLDKGNISYLSEILKVEKFQFICIM